MREQLYSSIGMKEDGRNSLKIGNSIYDFYSLHGDASLRAIIRKHTCRTSPITSVTQSDALLAALWAAYAPDYTHNHHNSPAIHSEMLPILVILARLPPLHSMVALVILTAAVATAVEFMTGGKGNDPTEVILSNVNGPQSNGGDLLK